MPGLYARPSLELADIFRTHGPAWRRANAGHVSLTQLKVMSAIEACRTESVQIACWNKKAVYDLLFCASAETVLPLAADPRRLGARVGMTSVLHTWGSALIQHPHIHMIVPAAVCRPTAPPGLPTNPGSAAYAAPPGPRSAALLHVRVLSRLFRHLFLEGLIALHRAGDLAFFGDLAGRADLATFAAWLAPLRKSEWVVIVPEARLRHDAPPSAATRRYWPISAATPNA